jgi:hypothetical protein
MFKLLHRVAEAHAKGMADGFGARHHVIGLRATVPAGPFTLAAP